MRWIRQRILNWIVRDLFVGLTEDDILKFHIKKKIDSEGKPYVEVTGSVGRTKLSRQDITHLKSESKRFRKTYLYKIIIRNMVFSAESRMFAKANNADDLFFGKAMLYCERLIEKTLDRIDEL